MWKYPTAFSDWGIEENVVINEVIASNQFTMGQRVADFEREFAKWHNMSCAIMVNSGSSANLIGIAAMVHTGVLRAGDMVAVPAVAWSTTYAPIIQYGLRPFLLDIDDTWNAPLIPVPEAVKLVIAVSILGNPAYLKQWQEYCTANKILMMEDNCESFGATTPEGTLCGTHGFINTFSFFYSHQISAIEGGMILTNIRTLAQTCRILRAHGWTRDVRLSPPENFAEEYDFVVMGYNVRPLEMHAAVASVQLEKSSNVQRMANLEHFYIRAAEAELPIIMQHLRGSPSPFGISFKVDSTKTREALAKALRAKGVDCRLPTGGSFRKHLYGAPYSKQQTPNADELHLHGMFLGNAPYKIDKEIDLAIDTMKEFFNG